jgi:hypothetical protein
LLHACIKARTITYKLLIVTGKARGGNRKYMDNQCITQFSERVIDAIGYYVYRLIDPRDGNTFYVGKGKGNRLYQHVSAALNFNGQDGEESDEDEVSAKIKIIRAIHGAGLEVLHIVHRHGMDKATALEVEAALIDAIPGLSNSILGNGSSSRGPMNASQIESTYGSQEIGKIPSDCVIIKVRQDVIDEKGDVYEAVRSCWKIGTDGRKNIKYVLAVVNGIVRGVYQNLVWQAVGDRWSFTAQAADAAIAGKYLDKVIPRAYSQRGAVNPIQYGKD